MESSRTKGLDKNLKIHRRKATLDEWRIGSDDFVL
jgi:hypothetical protein